nr:glycoprotein hormone alpha-2 isoform X1 [Oryctolagus cuniculus]XP_051687376.1 glycoprotein hormone alpha-2 isoform X1 [Oryctolagus cuniculus]
MVPARYPQALLLCLLVVLAEGWGREAATPGCHLHPFNVTVRSDRQGTCRGSHVAQACVGHCESSAFPSRYSVLVASGYRHNITSVSQCCTISSLEKVRGARAGVGEWDGASGGGRREAGTQDGPAQAPGADCPGTGEGAAAVPGPPEGAARDLHGQGLPVRHVPPRPPLARPPPPSPGPGLRTWGSGSALLRACGAPSQARAALPSPPTPE